MLKVAPDGRPADTTTGRGHTDAEPLIEGVADFEVAVGIDANANGTILESTTNAQTTLSGGLALADEWIGNHTADDALPSPPWDPSTTTTGPPISYTRLRDIRVSLIVRTLNTYSGV